MDSRFKLKGTFSIYGKDFPMDMNLNWSAQEGDIDRRIHEFFSESYAQAHEEYEAEVEEANERRGRSETEAKERAELKRLQEKYK